MVTLSVAIDYWKDVDTQKFGEITAAFFIAVSILGLYLLSFSYIYILQKCVIKNMFVIYVGFIIGVSGTIHLVIHWDYLYENAHIIAWGTGVWGIIGISVLIMFGDHYYNEGEYSSSIPYPFVFSILSIFGILAGVWTTIILYDRNGNERVNIILSTLTIMLTAASGYTFLYGINNSVDNCCSKKKEPQVILSGRQDMV